MNVFTGIKREKGDTASSAKTGRGEEDKNTFSYVTPMQPHGAVSVLFSQVGNFFREAVKLA